MPRVAHHDGGSNDTAAATYCVVGVPPAVLLVEEGAGGATQARGPELGKLAGTPPGPPKRPRRPQKGGDRKPAAAATKTTHSPTSSPFQRLAAPLAEALQCLRGSGYCCLRSAFTSRFTGEHTYS